MLAPVLFTPIDVADTAVTVAALVAVREVRSTASPTASPPLATTGTVAAPTAAVTGPDTVARAIVPRPPEPSGEMRRDTVLAHEPGLAAVARKLVAGVPWLSRTVHSAAVDGSTRTIHAAGPPFSKKPNTDSAHTPLEVAGPNTRT
jgi:hypothetical protein